MIRDLIGSHSDNYDSKDYEILYSAASVNAKKPNMQLPFKFLRFDGSFGLDQIDSGRHHLHVEFY